MADDEIVQKVVIEVDDKQLQQIGETAGESFDKLKEQTDKATESLEKLGDKAGETGKDLDKIGDGADESLGKVADKSDDAKDSLEKLAESGKHSFEEIQNGAQYAGTSLEDFARLSEKTQEQYIEYANRIVEANKEVGDSMQGLGQEVGYAVVGEPGGFHDHPPPPGGSGTLSFAPAPMGRARCLDECCPGEGGLVWCGCSCSVGQRLWGGPLSKPPWLLGGV
jgi:hypothetical protein